MSFLQTDRLCLSYLSFDDCEFIVELLNEPSFKRYIGDKKVRSTDDARQYLRDGPIDNYERFGYGLYRVSIRPSGEPAGICGLVKREEFDEPDHLSTPALLYPDIRQIYQHLEVVRAAGVFETLPDARGVVSEMDERYLQALSSGKGYKRHDGNTAVPAWRTDATDPASGGPTGYGLRVDAEQCGDLARR